MIKELITFLLESFYKHKMVSYVKYQEDIYINSQNDNPYYQVSIDSDGSRLDKQITEGIITLQYNITVLGREKEIITAQDNALHIFLDVLEYMQNKKDNLSVHDYSVLSLSEYTDDKASGIRATLQLAVPSPINLCEYMDNIDEEKEIAIKENTLEMEGNDPCTSSKNESFSDDKEITLKPIKIF